MNKVLVDQDIHGRIYVYGRQETLNYIENKFQENSTLRSMTHYYMDFIPQKQIFPSTCNIIILDFEYFKSNLIEITRLIKLEDRRAKIIIYSFKELSLKELQLIKNKAEISRVYIKDVFTEKFEIEVLKMLGQWLINSLLDEEFVRKKMPEYYLKSYKRTRMDLEFETMMVIVDSVVKYVINGKNREICKKILFAAYLNAFINTILVRLDQNIREGDEISYVKIGVLDVFIVTEQNVDFIFIFRNMDEREKIIYKKRILKIAKKAISKLKAETFMSNILSSHVEEVLQGILARYRLSSTTENMLDYEFTEILYKLEDTSDHLRQVLGEMEEITCVNDSAEAKELITRQNFDVLVSSISVKNSDDILEELQILHRLNDNLQIIVYVAEEDQELCLQIINSEAIDFIILPTNTPSEIRAFFSEAYTTVQMFDFCYDAYKIEPEHYDELTRVITRELEDIASQKKAPEVLGINIIHGDNVIKYPIHSGYDIQSNTLISIANSLKLIKQDLNEDYMESTSIEISGTQIYFSEQFGFSFMIFLKNVYEGSNIYSVLDSGTSQLCEELINHTVTNVEQASQSYIDTLLQDLAVKASTFVE